MIPKAIVSSQTLVMIIDNHEVSFTLKNNSAKLKTDEEKKAAVATSNRLINFRSVFISLSLISSSELVFPGIIEKTAKRKAVAMEEKEREADITSV